MRIGLLLFAAAPSVDSLASLGGLAHLPRRRARPVSSSVRMYDCDGELSWLMTWLNKDQLLERTEELSITQAVHEWKQWCVLRDEMEHSIGRVPTDDEWASALGLSKHRFAAMLEEKNEARRRIIHSNMLLVISISNKYKGRGVPLPDLVQEGTIGLITAAEKFEPARGWRFSTYASYWIRQSVQRSIQNHARPIRIPSYMNERINAIRKARAIAYSGGGHKPTERDVASLLALTEGKVRRAVQADRTTGDLLSLEASFSRRSNSEADERSLLSVVADNRRRRPDVAIEEAEVAQAVDGLLAAALSPEERAVVELKYGLAGHMPHSIRQICAARGCRANSVQATLQRSMRKLRRERAGNPLLAGIVQPTT